MGRPRLFDWEEAARLHEAGMSYPKIGAKLGVSSAAVYQALNETARTRNTRRSQEWQRNGRCPLCGAPATRRSYAKQSLCKECYWAQCRDLALADRMNRQGDVHCRQCDKHHPITAFRLNRAGHPHQRCRRCESDSRQDRRLANAAVRAR